VNESQWVLTKAIEEEGVPLHITFTLRASGTLIRVISARDMYRKEKIYYEQVNKDTT
jgi:uncharacterized protein